MSLAGLWKRSISPISAAIVNARTQPIPGALIEERDVGMLRVAGPQPAVDGVDLALEVVDQSKRGGDVRAPGLGDLQRSSSSLPSTPNRSETGQGRPKLIRVEWIRFLSADLCLTR